MLLPRTHVHIVREKGKGPGTAPGNYMTYEIIDLP